MVEALTVKQVAAALQVRQHAVLTLIKSGALRGVDIALRPGSRPRWRIMADDLDAFLLKRTHAAAGPRKRRSKRAAVIEFI